MTKDRLLVIDDELGPRESLRFLFKDSYDVLCADSVDKGLEALNSTPPDCIISDIKMPGKSGIEGLKEIRSVDPQVSVIMLTGFGSLETAQKAIRYGATDYMQKPFNTGELREVVASHVQRTKLQRKQIATTDHLENLAAKLQSQLDEKEELAELGEKSSEFLHDLSNPICVINGYVKILLQEIADKRSENKEINVSYLEQIEKNVSRCQEMLTLWRERSTQINSSPRKVDIGDLVAEVTENAKTLAAQKNVHVVLNTGPASCLVKGNDVLIYRTIQNIVGNALEASPSVGGCVQVSWRIEGSNVRIEVEDNGGGFAPEKLDDMETKYYTTKGESGGMGLGLFITKNIVEAHEGSLILGNNESGTGALVSLVYPLVK